MVKWKLSETKWKNWLGGTIGALVAGAAIMLGGVVVGNTAISQLVGLAVAQSETVWNNVRDASVGDNLTNGILMTSIGVFDGTNFDRARGDITNGLDVDVTRMPGSGQTPADAFANPTTFSGTWSLNGIFNGTTWDRWRGLVSPGQVGTILNSRTVSAADTLSTITLTGVASTRIYVHKVTAYCNPNGTTTMSITDGGTLVTNIASGIPPLPTTFEKTWATGLTSISAGSSMVFVLATCGPSNVSVLEVEANQF